MDTSTTLTWRLPTKNLCSSILSTKQIPLSSPPPSNMPTSRNSSENSSPSATLYLPTFPLSPHIKPNSHKHPSNSNVLQADSDPPMAMKSAPATTAPPAKSNASATSAPPPASTHMAPVLPKTKCRTISSHDSVGQLTYCITLVFLLTQNII